MVRSAYSLDDGIVAVRFANYPFQITNMVAAVIRVYKKWGFLPFADSGKFFSKWDKIWGIFKFPPRGKA